MKKTHGKNTIKIVIFTLLTILLSIILGIYIGITYTIKTQQISVNPNTLQTETTYKNIDGYHRDVYNGSHTKSVY